MVAILWWVDEQFDGQGDQLGMYDSRSGDQTAWSFRSTQGRITRLRTVNFILTSFPILPPAHLLTRDMVDLWFLHSHELILILFTSYKTSNMLGSQTNSFEIFQISFLQTINLQMRIQVLRAINISWDYTHKNTHT